MKGDYRYEIVLKVQVVGDGIHSDGAGAKATINRLADLIEADEQVISCSRWPEIAYRGHYHPSAATKEPDPVRAAAQDDPRGEADR